jgi:hypothetical protein
MFSYGYIKQNLFLKRGFLKNTAPCESQKLISRVYYFMDN